MRKMRILAFAAALPLVACGSGPNADSDARRVRQTAFYHSASDAEASSVTSLSAKWFDGFVLRGRFSSGVKATPEEIDAYLYSRGRGGSSIAMSDMAMGASGR